MAERVFQSGLGTEWERAYKEGTKVSSLILAQVIKVNYQYNSVDLVTSGNKDTFQSSYTDGGKFSARLPLEFGGRNSVGQPYGQVKPVNVGDTVLVGFVNENKLAPVVLGVYGNSTVNEMLSRTPFKSADYQDETLVRQTNQKFSLYPSLTYENVDGEGNRTVTFTGKSFLMFNSNDNKTSALTDGNHGTEYGELESSYYSNDEEIEPMNPYAPNILFKHQGVMKQSGGEDNHVTLFHVKDDGTVRMSTMDKADDWRTYFEMTPNGGVKLRKQFDSKIVGQALKSSELGVAEDGTVFLKNGDTYLEVKADGIYSNGLNVDVDLTEIQNTLDEQGKKLVILDMSVTKTNEALTVIASKTEIMENQVNDISSELVIMAGLIESKVSEAQVKDIVTEEINLIAGDIEKIKEDNERLTKLIDDMSDDGLITPVEKDTLMREWVIIQDEYPTYVLQADEYEVDKTTYVSAYNALSAYLTTLFAKMDETTAIDPKEFRAKFKAYYDARLAILTAILLNIKELAVEAMKKASEASVDATNAWQEATKAQLDANTANSKIADMASDGKLTPVEKYELKREYDTIVKEHPSVVAQATKYEVATTNYVSKYNALVSYVTGNKLFDDMGETVAVDGERLRATFSDYYLEKVKLLRAVTDKAKDITDEHEGRIYVAETKITQTSEAIALLATKVETIEGTVETHTAELKVQADQISQKVTASQVAQQIKDTEIGMTNGLRNSGLVLDNTYWTDWVSSSAVVGTRARVEVAGLPNLGYGFEITKTSTGDGHKFGYYQEGVVVLPATEYTISFWAKAKTGTVTSTLQKSGSTEDTFVTSKAVGTKWTRVSYTWKTAETTTKINYALGMADANTGTVQIAGMKLETGSKATAWSPSPLDSKAEIQDEIAKTPIGGTNYIAFSSGNKQYPRLMIKNVGYYSATGGTTSFDGETVKMVPNSPTAGANYNIGSSSVSDSRVGLPNYGLTALKEGDYVTFSADVSVTGGTAFLCIYLLDNGTWREFRSDIINPSDGVKRAVVLAKITSATEGILCRVAGVAGFASVNFSKTQLETGMKSTAWKKSDLDLQNDMDNAVTTGIDVIDSRMSNLVTNGYGTLGSNRNFGALVFDPLDKTVGGGSFKYESTGGGQWFTDEYIPVNPTHIYEASYYAKTKLGTSRSYFCYAPYDVDKQKIEFHHCGGLLFVDAKPIIVKLAKPLKVGDTEVWLDDVSQFPTNLGDNAPQHSIALWNYTDDSGKNYGTTYTRYTYTYAYKNGAVDATNKKITLKAPWSIRNKLTADGSFPVGHPVSKTSAGSGYMYPNNHTNKVLTTSYTSITNTTAMATAGGAPMNSATTYLKLGLLCNRDVTGGDTTYINGLSLVDSTDKQDLQVQINGKEGAIMKQPSAPTNPAVGLIWVDTSVVPNVANRWDGTAWVKMSPTEAKEIGAFNDSDGRDLIDRMSSAEQKITSESITNTVLESNDFTSLFDTKANSEDLLDLATIDQLNSQYNSFESLLEQKLGEAYSTLYERQSQLEQLVDGFDFKIQQAGGINMLRNSLGFSGLDFWGDTNGNGRNFLLGANTRTLSPYGGANIVSTPVQEDGIKGFKITNTNGKPIETTGNIFGTLSLNPKANTVAVKGQEYTHSVWIRNDASQSSVVVSNNIDKAYTVPPNTTTFVTLTAVGNGAQYLQFVFRTGGAGQGANFTFWNPKIELGSESTPFSYAPEDTSVDGNGLTTTTQDNALANLGFGSGFVHKAGGVRLIQNVVMPARGTYTMSFFMKKSTSSGTHGGAGVELFADGKRLAFIGAEEGVAVGEYSKYSYTFDTADLNISVQMVAWGNINTTVIMSGLMFNIGSLALTWQPFPSEIYNTNVLIDINGITVKNNQTNGYTLITPTEFSGYAQVGNEMTRIFTLNGKTTEVEEIQVRSKIQMGAITVLPIDSDKNVGWAFIG